MAQFDSGGSLVPLFLSVISVLLGYQLFHLMF
nr:hypothetical protein [uncultured Mediterranean phage uvMED]